MKEVTMYQTTDDQTFSDKVEADSHESRLTDIKSVNDYLDTQEWKRPAVRTKSFNAIMGFLDWKNRPSAEVVQLPEADAK